MSLFYYFISRPGFGITSHTTDIQNLQFKRHKVSADTWMHADQTNLLYYHCIIFLLSTIKY